MDWEGLLEDARNAWREGRQRDALQLCDRAALGGRSARYAAGVLRGRMLLQLGDPAGALSSFDTVADVRVPDPELDCARGQALFELGKLAEAENALRSATRGMPNSAEAYYTLGLVAEILGTGEEVECFRTARRLAPDRYPPSPRLAPEQFEEWVERALSALPESIRDTLLDIPIVIVELPEPEDLRHCDPPLSPTALGVCVELSDPQRAGLPSDTRAERAMVLFKRNLERAFPEGPALLEGIRRAIVAELGHAVDRRVDDPNGTKNH